MKHIDIDRLKYVHPYNLWLAYSVNIHQLLTFVLLRAIRAFSTTFSQTGSHIITLIFVGNGIGNPICSTKLFWVSIRTNALSFLPFDMGK